MSQNTDPLLYKKLTRLYLLALSAVAILTIGGQLLVQHSLKSQQNDARVINVAGRQRMLSQKISKTVLLLHTTTDHQNRATYLTELDAALDVWKRSHNGLKQGNLAHLKTPVHLSPTIKNSFKAIDSTFHSLYTNARIISNHFHANGTVAPFSTLNENLEAILTAEPEYLQGMDQIVFQFDQEAAQRVNHSRQVEQYILWITLAILALEALFIFRPVVNQIKGTIAQLIQSENHAQKINEELSQTNQSLQETQAALVTATEQKYQQELNDQRLRSAYLMEGQEEERKRVSKEIHDGLGQMLTALKFGIEKIGDSVTNTEKAQKDLSSLRDLVSQTITEARSISFDLMPAVLNDFGVASALKLLCSQLSTSTGKKILFSSNWQGQRVPKNMEIGLYRIAQEALHNALKYALAEEFTVDLSVKKKYIHLRVSDNGRGFEYISLVTGKEQETPSHGLNNMRERVHLMNGQIDITSSPETGTQIHVKIPCPTHLHA